MSSALPELSIAVAEPHQPAVTAVPAVPARNARLAAMLEGPVLPTLLRLAWPNLLMTLAQSSTGLIETFYLSRLGTNALAGAALVMPLLMLMQNMSQGAMGGGISSAIARALGARRQPEADRLVLHAVLLNAGLGLLFSALLLGLGSRLYRAMGGEAGALEAALTYSNVVFGGLVLMWVMNALASVVRGTGNMMVPGLVICGGALMLIPLSGCLVFGLGPFPRLGIAGAGWAMLSYYGVGTAVLGWYVLSGRNPARLQCGTLAWPLARDILKVGGLAALNPLLTNGLIASTTALVGAYAGTEALAGYGTAARLEYLVLPAAFGIGAALDPQAWMRLFGATGRMLEVGSTHLRVIGPFFGFFGLGFTLYFASQGAGRLGWPLASGAVRLAVAAGLGWAVLRFTGSLPGFFAASALAMVLYGTITTTAIASGAWFCDRRNKQETT